MLVFLVDSGVELIDKDSKLFKHIHDLEEMEEMSRNLSLLKKGKPNVRRSARRKPVKPKRTTALSPQKPVRRGRGRPSKKKSNSDSEDSAENIDEVEVDGDFFDPPGKLYIF